MLRDVSAHTVVGFRPFRVPMVETTASLPVTASTIVAGSMTSNSPKVAPGSSRRSAFPWRTITAWAACAVFDVMSAPFVDSCEVTCRSRRGRPDVGRSSRKVLVLDV